MLSFITARIRKVYRAQQRRHMSAYHIWKPQLGWLEWLQPGPPRAVCTSLHPHRSLHRPSPARRVSGLLTAAWGLERLFPEASDLPFKVNGSLPLHCQESLNRQARSRRQMTPLPSGRSCKEQAAFWIYHTRPNLVTIEKNEMFYQFCFHATLWITQGHKEASESDGNVLVLSNVILYLLNVPSLLWSWSHNCTHGSEWVKLHS